MANDDSLTGVIAIGALLVAGYLYIDNKKKSEEIKTLNQEREHLKVLLQVVHQNSQFDEQMKQKIEQLISQFEEIDPAVASELAQALQLLQIGQTENAIEDFVKIMEHLLNRKYSTDSAFDDWIRSNKKKRDLHNLLQYSKETKFISEIEYTFFIAIKTIRNKEDHTLDLRLDRYLNASGLLTAIGAIMKIGASVYSGKRRLNIN